MIDVLNNKYKLLKVPLRFHKEINEMKYQVNKSYAYHEMEALLNRDHYNNFYINLFVGRKYITVWLKSKHYSPIYRKVFFATQRKLKILKTDIDNDTIEILQENQNETFSIYKINKNDEFYYAVIYLENLIEDETEIIDDCVCCLNINQQGNKDGYFQCSHRNVCSQCYYQLKEKSCPLCRAEKINVKKIYEKILREIV